MTARRPTPAFHATRAARARSEIIEAVHARRAPMVPGQRLAQALSTIALVAARRAKHQPWAEQ